MIIHCNGFRGLANRLKREYGFKRTREGRTNHPPDYNSTVFVYYPERVRNAPDFYHRLSLFTRSSKAHQRTILKEYVDIPKPYPDGQFPYVARPLTHHGGQDFNVINNEEELVPFNNNGYYVSELFKRDKEFRHIFVGGEHVVTLLKQRGEGLAQDQPWNHALGSTFCTITRETNDKLRQTTFYDQIKNFFNVYPLDVAAVDTAYRARDNKYVVFEINLAPRIEIDNTLAIIAEKLQGLR